MKITLFTETAIDSCHKLEGYDGLCRNMHGHTWLVQVWVRGSSSDCDEVGILFDFGKVKQLTQDMDHVYLNDVLGKNPTAENLVIHLYERLKDAYPYLEFKVRLYETAVLKKTWAEVGDWN